MALIEMIVQLAVVAERAQDRRAAHAEHHFLAEAIVAVAAVQVIGERLIPGRILGNRRVEQKHGDLMPGNTAYDITPRSHANGAPLDLYDRADRQEIKNLVRLPRYRLLGLRTGGVEMLLEIALTVEQRDANHRDAEISGGAQCVTRQNTKAATVGGNCLFEADLHREIGDCRIDRYQSIYVMTRVLWTISSVYIVHWPNYV